MRLVDLIALERVFFQSNHASCASFRSVVEHPGIDLSRWIAERRNEVAEVAERLKAVTTDTELRADLDAILDACRHGGKRAETAAEEARRERAVERRTAAVSAPLMGINDKKKEDFGDVG